MNIYDTANRLAEELRSSDECVRLRELKEKAMSDPTNKVLLDEYKKLQVRLVMSMSGSGEQLPAEDMQRFQQLSALLSMNQDVQEYLLAEMQMQRVMSDIFKTLTDAAGITFDLPEAN